MTRDRTLGVTLAFVVLAVCVVALRYVTERPWYERIDAGVQVSREVPPESRQDEDSFFDALDEALENLDFAHQEFEEPLSRETAYEILLKTEEFAGEAVGFGGECSTQVLAFRRVLRESDAARAYADLIDRGHPAGQLYALCGLYLTDPDAFRTAVSRYVRDWTPVETQWGCMGSEMTVSQLVPEIVSGKRPRAFRGRE